MDGLNPQQRAAVTHFESPLLVLAGAGSGKTRVITEKIAWLIDQGHFRASQIAAITFTNKAAREMRKRVGKRIRRKAAEGLTVSTFHSLGWAIVRDDPQAAGLKHGISILDQHAAADLVRELLPGAARSDQVYMAQAAIGRLKDAGIEPARALSGAESEGEAQLASVYSAYRQRLDELNAVDFDDLIALPAKMLDAPEMRARWRSRMRYFLVDEYQDTSAAQYRLLRRLSGESGTFTAVGDDDQSIYGWRGARPENLDQLGVDYPRLAVIKLEQNYRSVGTILKAANAVIAGNPHTHEKRLWSEHGPGDRIAIREYGDEVEEAEGIARALMESHGSSSMRWGHAAVLYRSNFQAREIEKALREYGIPYRISGGPSWFDAREIRDGLAYLKLLLNPEDNPSFMRVANTPRRGIGSSSMARLMDYARAAGQSLFEAAADAQFQRELPERAARGLRGFSNMLIDFNHRLERGEQTDTGTHYRELLEHIEYGEWLDEQSDKPEQARRRRKSLDDLVRWVERLSADTGSGDELIARVSLAAGPDDERDSDADEVRLMTLHAAKGLEFPRVWLAGLEDGLLPHLRSIEEGRIEEERRLMYVGLTRAERRLSLSFCKSRRQFGETSAREPSRFIEELPMELLDWPGKDGQAPPSADEARGNLAALKAMLDG
ncbi:MAG: UvrD-helicase domain-containing protein [Wenzhouxiangellaceae bacterium]|nr:UvrD-helicase domain-containing protein [Wenzhouxiangellaceae bacterium]MBS3745684.1 UvrD-helicase domain-containing protein [Wenzhouxiangellaceae bacterium]MBS3822416.1 UvrD-helicase domain-containing protein [Wenzhouxiangellaceae bacterium]